MMRRITYVLNSLSIAEHYQQFFTDSPFNARTAMEVLEFDDPFETLYEVTVIFL